MNATKTGKLEPDGNGWKMPPHAGSPVLCSVIRKSNPHLDSAWYSSGRT